MGGKEHYSVIQQFYTQPNYTSSIITDKFFEHTRTQETWCPRPFCEKVPNRKSSTNQETNEETMAQGLSVNAETVLTQELILKHLRTVAT